MIIQYVMNGVSTSVHILRYPSSAVIATGSAATSCGKLEMAEHAPLYPSDPHQYTMVINRLCYNVDADAIEKASWEPSRRPLMCLDCPTLFYHA